MNFETLYIKLKMDSQTASKSFREFLNKNNNDGNRKFYPSNACEGGVDVINGEQLLEIRFEWGGDFKGSPEGIRAMQRKRKHAPFIPSDIQLLFSIWRSIYL